jgi:hypothetical protein
MDATGMVHALEKIHQLLRPDGRLIDLHPIGEPSPLEVRIGERNILAGWVTESDDFVEYKQADVALEQVVQCGLFVVERESTLSFITYADSVAELREYMAKEWKDAILDEVSARKAEDLLNMAECGKELILRDQVRIARLKPGQPPSVAEI